MDFNFGVIIIYPLFHLAIPLLLFEFPQIKKRLQVNRLALIIGSLIPDVIDKSLMFLGVSSGRGYCHTLLFVLISSLIIYVITKSNKVITLSYFIGSLIHLLLDLPDVPILFPFIPYQFFYLDDPFSSWLTELLNQPFNYVSEIIGFAILSFIFINNKLYRFKQFKDFLFKSSQIELELDGKKLSE
ncbi:MAG: metal-dependent hydrolase [Promethearchaeota archaeon]